jgi:hypothetical protein
MNASPVFLSSINLVVAFILELSLLAIFGYYGAYISQTRLWQIVAAAGFPLLLAVFWGIFLAPASHTRLSDPWLTLVKIVLFSAGTLFLFLTGLKGPAYFFGLVSSINLILLYIYK